MLFTQVVYTVMSYNIFTREYAPQRGSITCTPTFFFSIPIPTESLQYTHKRRLATGLMATFPLYTGRGRGHSGKHIHSKRGSSIRTLPIVLTSQSMSRKSSCSPASTALPPLSYTSQMLDATAELTWDWRSGGPVYAINTPSRFSNLQYQEHIHSGINNMSTSLV